MIQIEEYRGGTVWINTDMVMMVECRKPKKKRGAVFSEGSIITMAGGIQIHTLYPTTQLIATLGLYKESR